MLQLLDTTQTSFVYLRDKKVWDEIGNLQKAIILLHEAVYTELIISGKSSAPVVRDLTKHLLEASLGGITLNAHILKLRSSGIVRVPAQLLNLSRTTEDSVGSTTFASATKNGNYLSFFKSPDLLNCKFQITLVGTDVNQNSFDFSIQENEFIVVGARYYWSLPNLSQFNIQSLSFIVEEVGECKNAWPITLSLF